MFCNNLVLNIKIEVYPNCKGHTNHKQWSNEVHNYRKKKYTYSVLTPEVAIYKTIRMQWRML